MSVPTKLPPIKTGIDFLASSHFTIGKEPALLADSKNAYTSTVMADYPEQHVDKVGLCQLPPRAQIFTGDSTHVDSCSVTRSEFVQKPYARTDYSGQSYAKTETNFKPDSDHRIETFRTTNADTHVPFANQVEKSGFDAMEWKRSHIPQGDKVKEPWTDSDYKLKFVSHPVKNSPKKVNPTFYASNTIKGDIRSHGDNLFNTSSRRAFNPNYKNQRRSEVSYITKYPSTNIPMGDREKDTEMRSTMQLSFDNNDLDLPDDSGKSFNRNEALQKLQQTTFRDGDNRLNCFQSTAGECYSQHTPSTERPAGVFEMKNSGLNSMPEGDLHPDRVHERVNLTSNRKDFNQPPKTYQRSIVDGSHIRTKSNVTFGKDEEGEMYGTTTAINFPHKTSVYQKSKTQTCTSNIPLDYNKDIVPSSTYRSNYKPRSATKMVLNSVAIDNLKKSHIGDPIRDFRQFETTSQDTYTPKPECRQKNIDVGRLQRSNVPLGTMKKSGAITVR